MVALVTVAVLVVPEGQAVFALAPCVAAVVVVTVLVVVAIPLVVAVAVIASTMAELPSLTFFPELFSFTICSGK